MDNLEAFAIGWSSCSLLEHLRWNQQKEAMPFVPYVMKIFDLTHSRGYALSQIGILKKLDAGERREKIERYQSSLRSLHKQQDISEESRDQLVLFLESVSDYCLHAGKGHFHL